jgi:hypothetical protein
MVAEARFRSSPNGIHVPRPAEMLEDHPLTSVTMLFGIGLGVGFLLGHTIAEAAGRRLIHHAALTETLISQIRDALRNSLPQGLAQRLS